MFNNPYRYLSDEQLSFAINLLDRDITEYTRRGYVALTKEKIDRLKQARREERRRTKKSRGWNIFNIKFKEKTDG